jgi:hypothetical protein
MGATVKTPRWFAARSSLAIGLALAATVVTAPLASATARYDMWNLTGGPLVVDGDTPSPGPTIQPGQNHQVEVSGVLVTRTHVGFNGTWAKNGQPQKFAVRLYTSPATGNPERVECDALSKGTGVCTRFIGNNVVALADGSDTRITVPASDTVKQNQLRGNLCSNAYKPQLGISCTEAAGVTTVVAGNTTWTLQH